jgi:xanthine dehydrogenase YagR molybdenum-binding subunit
MTTAHIGIPYNRVDGRLKVTGGARYAGEHPADDLAYGVVVSATIGRGKITRIDASEALRVPGVVDVMTHENRPRMALLDRAYYDEVSVPGSPLRPLYDATVRYNTQPVALVTAETFEAARYAATLVKIDYESEPQQTDFEAARSAAYDPKPRTGMPPPDSRGDADRAFAAAAIRVDAEYRVPCEHHNPMEMFATTVLRSGDGKLTVYDKTQGVQNVRNYLRGVLKLTGDGPTVRVPYVGGAFGSGLRPQYPVLLATMAALRLKRSVRVTLTRQQMFSSGYRPATWQRVALGAAADGELRAIVHEAVGVTSRAEDYSEGAVDFSGVAYRCPDVRLRHQVTKLDLATPIDMRAPGAAWGLFALESAMDELAVALRMDPIDLRMRNHADRDQLQDLPFSSKRLRDCYLEGAKQFGWSERSAEPRSMRRAGKLIGMGMAGGIWEAQQRKAAAQAVFGSDGRLRVGSSTVDIGTGTYTIMTQIAAEALGLAMDHVTFELGDSALALAPVEGGSWTAATVGTAVKAACDKIRKELWKAARKVDGSPLAKLKFDDAVFADGRIVDGNDPSRRMSLVELMRAAELPAIEVKATAGPSKERSAASHFSHSAAFAEVEVDPDLGTVSVRRMTAAVAAGRILNPKTARNQVLGGMVWGLGMALEEESHVDSRYGRFINHDFASYHVPVNADVRDLDVIFIEEKDDLVNPLGVKGIGEIGVVGVAAAIANAVYHATGKRIRELPITLDKLLEPGDSGPPAGRS